MARRQRHSPKRFWWLTGLGMAVVLTAGIALAGVPVYPAWLGGSGLALFLLYGFDKHRATSGGRRVPEQVLHGMALAGGVVGGWLGRMMFRHKTRHSLFLVVLIVATLVHAGLLLLLLQVDGPVPTGTLPTVKRD